MTHDRNLKDQDVNAALRDMVREPADSLSSDGLEKALAEVATTPQVHKRRWWWPFTKESAPLPTTPETTLDARDVPRAGRPASPSLAPSRLSPVARIVAVGALVALVAFVIGTQIPSDDGVFPPAVSPSASPTVTEQPPPTPAEEPRPTPARSPGPSAATAADTLAPPTIVVGASDDADFATIAEAEAVAIDGDIIGVEPGTYDESFTIDKDLEVRGLGEDRSEVVIRITEDSPSIPAEDPEDGPVVRAITIIGADASINGLTIESSVLDGTGVYVEGGAPQLYDMAYRSEGQNNGAFFEFGDGAGGEVRDSTSTGDISLSGGATTLVTGLTLIADPQEGMPVTWIDGPGTTTRLIGNTLGSVAVEGGSPTLLDNVIDGSASPRFDCGIWTIDESPATTVTARDNSITGWSRAGICGGGGLLTVEGNTFADNTTGVEVGLDVAANVTRNTFESGRREAILADPGSTANIVGNTIRDHSTGIHTTADDATRSVNGVIDGNRLSGNGTGLDLDGSDQRVTNNTIEGGRVGILVRGSGSPLIEGNAVIAASANGIEVRTGASPTLVGNQLCASETNLLIEDGSGADVRDTEYCADDLAIGNVGPTSLDGGAAAVTCTPAQTCPLLGSGAFSSTGLERTTQLALATGSYLGGVGEPFRLVLLNDDNALAISGVAEQGTFHDDERFAVEMHGPTIGGDVATAESSDCTIFIDRTNAASISGTVSCEQHPTNALVNGLEALIDIDAEFSARATARGAASAWREASFWEGFEGEMQLFDSVHLLVGRLDSMTAQFPAGPFELHYVDDEGGTLTIRGRTTPGSYSSDDDGFGLLLDSRDSGLYDTDSARTPCEIEVERADEGGIEGAWSCPVLGEKAGGWFTAIP